MPNPPTLVVITPAFPEHESATWWVPSQQLMVKALQENHPGTRITVLSLIYPYHQATYQWHGITVQAFDGMHQPNIQKLGLYRKVWRALQQLQRQCQLIGLFSCWNGESALLAHYFGKRYGIPHISWICGQDAKRSNWWVRIIRPHADQLAAMATTLRDRYERSHGIRPRHLVPNAIDPRSFPAALPAVRDIDIMAAGSFEPLKQYDQYTRIVDRLRHALPGLNTIHCGIGREQPKVEALIHALQLQNHLRLLGGKPHADILSLMQRSRLFLHTSRYEGCSTVCLEALYAGAHVISYCYPFDHAVPHWHVVKDATEMEAKALELLQDTELVHERILYQSMEDSARALMQLFRPETHVACEYPLTGVSSDQPGPSAIAHAGLTTTTTSPVATTPKLSA